MPLGCLRRGYKAIPGMHGSLYNFTSFWVAFGLQNCYFGIPFGFQNADCGSSESRFSLHPETLVATGAPKGKIMKIEENLSSALGAIWESFSEFF